MTFRIYNFPLWHTLANSSAFMANLHLDLWLNKSEHFVWVEMEKG